MGWTARRGRLRRALYSQVTKRKISFRLSMSPYVRIYLSKAKEVIEDIAKTYKGRVRLHKAGKSGFNITYKNYPPIWYVLFDSCVKIKPFLLDLIPYMRVKKKQAELLLEYCKLRGIHARNTPVEKDLPKILAISRKIKELNSGHRKKRDER